MTQYIYISQSAADTPLSEDEEEALHLHGFGRAALGDSCPTWLKKFAAMQVCNEKHMNNKYPKKKKCNLAREVLQADGPTWYY